LGKIFVGENFQRGKSSGKNRRGRIFVRDKHRRTGWIPTNRCIHVFFQIKLGHVRLYLFEYGVNRTGHDTSISEGTINIYIHTYFIYWLLGSFHKKNNASMVTFNKIFSNAKLCIPSNIRLQICCFNFEKLNFLKDTKQIFFETDEKEIRATQ
jgi:hypothetical protein